MLKKIYFGGKFYFFKKKGDFLDVFSAFYGQRSVTASWATRSPWSIFSVFCFWPTSGNLPRVKICFHQYFGITRRYMPKKIFFLGNFYFFTKKPDFREFFLSFYDQRSVTAAWATRSPWSINFIWYKLP